jgi:hypothetical protein
MAKRKPLEVHTYPDLVLSRDGQTVRLDAEDLTQVISRMVAEGQLVLHSTNQDWLYCQNEILVESDAEGIIYLTPCDGLSQPSYTVALPEPYVDSEGRICNPYGT